MYGIVLVYAKFIWLNIVKCYFNCFFVTFVTNRQRMRLKNYEDPE